MLKIAIVGDHFVHADLLAERLTTHLAAVTNPFALAKMMVGWPDTPQQHNAEIREFVGDEAEIVELAQGAAILVTHVAPVSRTMLQALPELRLIGCCRGGPVNINVAAATARGIPVVNAPARNAQAVIEFTLGAILSECRGIGRAHKALSQGIWQGELYRYARTGRELQGQTIGLIGLGAIAQGLVPYLKPFNLCILAFDPYVQPRRAAELGVELLDLPQVLQQSDIVSLHARVTPETTGLMGAREFAWMKRGAYFINTARGGHWLTMTHSTRPWPGGIWPAPRSTPLPWNRRPPIGHSLHWRM
ncbi:MAG: NAD(P)-dependent oxidoreductase [Caldilineaceae bacterium]